MTATAIALRRELDAQGGTENLHHMIREMIARPKVLSRARFRSTWEGHLEYYTADRAFEEFPIVKISHSPEQDHIDPAMFRSDIERLESHDRVLDHVQTTIAHRVPERFEVQSPTFAELDIAVDVVGEVFEHYYGLFTHRTLAARVPTEQYDLFEPFRFPWIADSTFDYDRARR